MKETGKNQEIDNLIAEEMRTAFGYGKDHLIEEFDEAAMQMDETDRVPPEGEFEKIAAEVHTFDEEKKKSSKKVVRLKRVGKAGLLVAILGCVVLGTGIGASGKRYYEYGIITTARGKDSSWNNVEYVDSEIDIEKAYLEIKEKLGMDSLHLIRIPQGMKLTGLIIGEGYSRMEFTCDDGYAYFVQSQHPVESSGNTISDCEEIKSIYNRGLDKSLAIKKNKLPDRVEYSSDFVIDKTYYQLTAAIGQEEFEQILKKINR